MKAPAILLVPAVALLVCCWSIVTEGYEGGKESVAELSHPFFHHVNDFESIVGALRDVMLSPSQKETSNDVIEEQKGKLPFMVAIFIQEGCAHSSTLLRKLREVARELQYSQHLSFDPPIVWGILELGTMDQEFSQALLQDESHRTPQLYLFSIKDSSDAEASSSALSDLVVTEYVGAWDTTDEIRRTLLHFHHRHVHGNVLSVASSDDILPRLFDRDTSSWLNSVTSAVHPDYRPEEAARIRWLMDTNKKDPFVILIMCQGEADDTAADFERVCNRLALRRDVVCFSLFEDIAGGPCAEADWYVQSWLVDADDKVRLRQTRKPPNMSVSEFAVKQSTPSILFFDRRQTAPIAFPSYRPVHAALFVRLLGEPDDASKEAVQALHESCLRHRLVSSHDMVCLVIVETETRILTSFGIDIWTPYDLQATKGVAAPEVLLPVLLLTDKRQQTGLRRFYLNAPDIISDPASSLSKFIGDFWSDGLEPDVKSSNRPLKRNKSGVEMLNATAFESAVSARPGRHSLVFFMSPTCGHCKRFAVVWNRVAQLVSDVGWDKFVDIQTLDVTKNDVSTVVDPMWLPAVFYFDANNVTAPLGYDILDKFGDGPGRLSGPMDVVEWFLASAQGLDESKLLDDLVELHDFTDGTFV